MTEALRLIADAHVNVAPFINARFPLADIERAYATAREGGRTPKVLLRP